MNSLSFLQYYILLLLILITSSWYYIYRRAMFSVNFAVVSPNLAIDGQISNNDALCNLASNYKSILYLCPDTPDDLGCTLAGGFDAVRSAFGADNSHSIPLAMSLPAFNSDTIFHEQHAMAAYDNYQNTISCLPAPLVVTCKSNRRASVVVATYLGVQRRLSPEEVEEDSGKRGFTYLQSAELRKWSAIVLNTMLRKASSRLIFRQLFEKESSTYTYLLADALSKEAVLIDPVLETVERDAQLVQDLGLSLKYCLNTHVHADHVTGSGLLKRLFPECRSVIAESSDALADVKVVEGNRVVFGARNLLILATPGHTNGCLSFLLDDCSAVFTGDALLIRGCGRTDFQGGSAAQLYSSVQNKLFILPKSCQVYPAHNYVGLTSSTIAEEMQFNPRLKSGVTVEQFEEIMGSLNLPYPGKIDVSLPANRVCGV